MDYSTKVLLKAVFSSLFILTTIFFTGIASAQFQGPSLYSAIPLITWGSFGAALVGICVVVLLIDRRSKRVFGYGFGLLIVLYGGFYYLPEAAGLVMYGSFSHDQLVHMGRIKDLIATGELTHLRYPGTYVLGGILTVMTGVEVSQLQYLISFLTTILLIFSVYYCTFTITEDVWLARSAAVVSFPLYFDQFQMGIMPWLFAFAFLPILFGATYRAKTDLKRYVVIVLTLIATISIFHPFTAALAAVMVLSVSLFQEGGGDRVNLSQTLNYSVTLSLAFVGWQVYTGSIDSIVRHMLVGLLVPGGGGVEAANEVQRFRTTDQSIWELIWEFLILEWGAVLGLLGLALVSILLQVVLYRKGVPITRFRRICTLNFVFGVGLAALIIFVNITGFGPVRANQYSIYFATFLVAFLIVGIQREGTKRMESSTVTLTVGVVIALVMVLLLLSLGTVYEPNKQISQSDAHEATWLLEEQDPDHEVYNSNIRNKYPRYYYGDEMGVDKRSQGYLLANRTVAIQSFCTPVCDFNRFESPSYFSITSEVRSKIHENLDRNGEKIYSNGNNRIYYYNGS